MTQLPIISIIPMKPISDAKSRLSPYLGSPDRQRLALNMLRLVIKAASAASKEVWVLGSDPITKEIALSEGARWKKEQGNGVNQSLRLSFEEAWALRAAALFLPGDLPILHRQDVIELTRLARGIDSVALAPAGISGGTNGILLPTESNFYPRLGPDSFKKHLLQSIQTGLKPAVYISAGLSLDIDTWTDVEACEAVEPGLLRILLEEETPRWLEKV